jgi:rhodanese-related sulfurtransferase
MNQTEISAAEYKSLAASNAGTGVLLLDCRTAEEYAIAKIEGSVLIPMQEIGERLAELEPWRDKPIIVHCHHGVRSLRVTHFLREKGFSQAQSMKGGIDAWSVEVDPSVPRY